MEWVAGSKPATPTRNSTQMAVSINVYSYDIDTPVLPASLCTVWKPPEKKGNPFQTNHQIF